MTDEPLTPEDQKLIPDEAADLLDLKKRGLLGWPYVDEPKPKRPPRRPWSTIPTKVHDALAEIGVDLSARAIRRALAERGIVGDVNKQGRCVLANFIKQVGGANITDVQVDLSEVSWVTRSAKRRGQTGRWIFHTTRAMERFIEAFDQKHYPELIRRRKKETPAP